MNMRWNLAALLIASLAATGLRADDKLPTNDKEFVMKAASCGHAEVKFSELADSRAADPKVKEFAAMMVKDHSEANARLAEHAKNQKIAVAAGFERDKRDIYMNLSKLNGAEFDKAYMKQMVDNHENAVKMLENQVKISQDADLKKYAEDSLPKIREHLKKAKEIHDVLGK